MGIDPLTDNQCPDPNLYGEKDILEFKTKACGTFQITCMADIYLREDSNLQDKKYLLAGAVREAFENGQKLLITSDNIDQIIDSGNKPKNPLEAIDRILFFLIKYDKAPNDYIKFDWLDYTLTYSRNFAEFEYYLEKAKDLDYIEIQKEDPLNCRLTLKGWQKAEILYNQIAVSDKVFVAMWFDPQMDEAWKDGFEPAFRHCGFNPFRIDLILHNDKIDDRIIAEIKRSGLIVADFTGNRGGVYFEAGFAMGLGRKLIWTCREDYIDKVHFDTRQYSHIVWCNSKDLKEKLIARIEATVL